MTEDYFRKVRFQCRSVGNAEIIFARFSNPSLFVLSLLRVSEYKECVIHAGKVFANTRYRTWFRGEHNGFDYEDFVLGMNLPDTNFKDFYEAFIKAKGRNKINRFETGFLHLLQDAGFVCIEKEQLHILKKFFVIPLNDYLLDYYKTEEPEADMEGDTLRHEISHSLYYLSDEYRTLASELWKELPDEKKGQATQFLQKHKYFTQGVVIDEFIAHCIFAGGEELPFSVDTSRLEPMIEAVRNS